MPLTVEPADTPPTQQTPSRPLSPQGGPAAPLSVAAPDAGVIEEARRRQQRRRAGAYALITAAVVAGLALLLGAGGNGNPPTSDAHLSARRPMKLTFVHGYPFINDEPALAGISPSLQAGNVGVCIMAIGGGSCNGAPPTKATPIYGSVQGFSPKEKVGPEGEIDMLFVSQRVAAVHVAQLGTFKARHYPGLPPGAREIIFYRPPGSRGTVLPPGLSPSVLQDFEHGRRGPALTETLLDSSGRVIPVSGIPETFTLPNSYWQGTHAPPANGRCAISSSFPGATTAWGQVTREISPNSYITVPAWLTCVHVWFSIPGASLETALLLNAKAPGSAPAPLWGAVPVPGHPGIVEIPPVEREFHLPPLSAAAAKRILVVDTKHGGRARAEQVLHESEHRTVWDVLVPAAVARRVGPAWLLVREGDSLQQRIAFLQSLHVTRMAIH
ncbi:MAG: hypothetical protein ABR992_01890 [Solirubrobacteraceae bacterium]|jgi:hypothetical protein